MPIHRLEKDIERKVCEYAKSKGILTPKIRVIGERGWPDRIFIDQEGWHVYWEFKRPGERLEPIQAYRIAELAKRHIISLIIDNEEEGIEYVDKMVAARVPTGSDPDADLPGERRIITGSRIRKN